MTMPSKKLVLPMCALALVAAGGFGVAQVSAASDTGSGQTSIVQKLADTFHLDKTKVQAVFDQQHQENQAKHEANYDDRLTKAVTAGKLTADQKTKILDEHKKLQAEVYAAMKTDTAADKTARMTALDKIRTEAADWAKANNIDVKWLMMGGPGGMGGRGHKGHVKPMGPDHDADDAGAPVPAASPAS